MDAASSIASGNVLCGVYGLALGLSFNRGAYGQEHGPLLLLCCIVLVEAALGLLRMRKGGKAQLLGPVQVVVVVLGLAALLPSGLPLQGLADAPSIVAWLLFWAALSSGMLGFSEHRPLTSVALFAVAFVAGRLAADFGFGPLLASVGQIGGIVGLTASIVAIAAPCYLLAERFSGRKVTSADRDDPEMAYAPTFDGRFDALARQHGLTPREREVLELIARGRNRQYVAKKLVISEGTAKTHIKRIYAKLGIHSERSCSISSKGGASAPNKERAPCGSSLDKDCRAGEGQRRRGNAIVLLAFALGGHGAAGEAAGVEVPHHVVAAAGVLLAHATCGNDTGGVQAGDCLARGFHDLGVLVDAYGARGHPHVGEGHSEKRQVRK